MQPEFRINFQTMPIAAIFFALLGMFAFDAMGQSRNVSSAATEVKLEESNPTALRRRKAQIESENVQLKSTLADRKKEIEEIRLIELEIGAGSDSRQGLDTSVITDIDRNSSSVYSSELRARASAALDNIRGTGRIRVDADRLTSFAAKKLALDLRRGFGSSSSRIEIPKECMPTKPTNTPNSADLDKVVSDCVAAVQRLTSSTSLTGVNPAQQEVSRVKAAIETEISTTSKRISDNDLLILEVDSMLGTSNDLTETIVRWTIPSLGVLLILILLGPRLYSNAIQENIFSTKLILELLTVYILVSTILILGLANRIQNEVLGTLLGGISGYVLGRSLGNRNSESIRTEARSNPQ